MASAGDGQIALHTPVQQRARLKLRGWRIRKGIAAAVVVEVVLADIRSDGQQHVRRDGALEAGRGVPGHYALMLILIQRVVGVGDLYPVSSDEEIQVEDVALIGLIIEAIEDG